MGEDGLWRRVEYLDAEGELIEVKELEVLEVNGEIAEDEFQLELAEGTVVIDETAQVLYDLRRSHP